MSQRASLRNQKKLELSQKMNKKFRLCNVGTRIQVDQEGLKRIKCIKQKIIPVCTIGTQLTGKSRLLNMLIGENIFEVGSTTKPTTQGIWAYPQIKKSRNEEVCILYLDVQGFDRIDTTPNTDHNIFTLLLCINAHLLYTSFGALDSATVNRVASLKKNFESADEIKSSLTFVQRDFSLTLVDQFNQLLSIEEYLENCLHSCKKDTAKALFQLFKQRINCVVFPPSSQSKTNQSLLQVKEYIFSSSSFSVVQFFTRLTQSLDFIHEQYKILDLSSIKHKIQEQKHIQWRLNQEILNQRLKKIKQSLPTSYQMLDYNLSRLKNQCWQNFSDPEPYLRQLIGDKVNQYLNKQSLSIQSENQQTIHKLIKQKVDKRIQQASLQMINNQKNLQEDIQKDLHSAYVYIQERDQYFIKFTIADGLWKKYESLRQKQAQKIEIEGTILQKQKQIKEKDRKIQSLTTQLSAVYKQYQESIGELHKIISEVFNKQTKTCINIKEKLTKLLQLFPTEIQATPKLKEKQPESCFSSQLGELVSLVGNLNKAVSNKQDSMEKSIQEYQEKLSKMEEVNKFLRKEINSPCTAINTISQQYQQLKADEQRRRAEYEAMLEGRNQRILEIMNKNQLLLSQIDVLKEELKLMRVTVEDRTKGSDFMQNLMKEKDQMIDRLRKEMMERVESSNQNEYEFKKKHQRDMNQINQMYASVTVQNDLLTEKVKKIDEKLKKIESQNKTRIENIQISYKDQITQLQQQIQQGEANLTNCAKSFQEIVNQLEEVLKTKEKQLAISYSKMSEIDIQKNRYCRKLKQAQQRLQEYHERLCTCQLEKEETEARYKRQMALWENRHRYLEHQAEKCKLQLKEKEKMFQLMLMQLRGNKIIESKGFDQFQTVKNKTRKDPRVTDLLEKVQTHIKTQLIKNQNKKNQENDPPKYPLTEKKNKSSTFHTITKI